MNIARHDFLAHSLGLVELAAHVAIGLAVGLLFFRALWWSAHRVIAGGGGIAVLLTMLARFALLGGPLFFASQEGAAPLLATAAGVFIGRALVMRRARELLA